MKEAILFDLLSTDRAATEKRFWKFVDRRGPDECWEWTGARLYRAGGYGNITIRQKQFRAHRVSFIIANGWSPRSVCHTCDNPPCVNPSHLFGGTQVENMADALRKGRVRNGPRPRGERHFKARLTDEAVREARRLSAAGMSFRALARRYRIDRNAITKAVRRESWSHVV